MKMLRVSKMTDYGTLVMTYLAHQPEQVRNAAEIAAATGIATPTVSKLLKILARGQLVVSFRGAKGGYALARAPSVITVAQIISVLEGPIGLTECGSSPGLCIHETCCSIRHNWQKINQGIRIALEAITLEELAAPVAHGTTHPVPLYTESGSTIDL